MSINSTITAIDAELTRISTAKNAIVTAINGKGVTVPAGSSIDSLAGYVNQIQQGSTGDDGIPTLSYSATGASVSGDTYLSVSGSDGGSYNVTMMQGTVYSVIPGSYSMSAYAPTGYNAAWTTYPAGASTSGSTLSGSIAPSESLTAIVTYSPRTDCQLAVYCALASGPPISGTQWSIDGGATWTESGAKRYDITYGKEYTIIGSDVPGYITPEPTTYTMLNTTDTSTSIYYEVSYATDYTIYQHADSSLVGTYTRSGSKTKTINGVVYPCYVLGNYWLAPFTDYSMGSGITYALVTADVVDSDDGWLPDNMGYSMLQSQPMSTWSRWDGDIGTTLYFNVGTTQYDGDTIAVSGNAAHAGTYIRTTASSTNPNSDVWRCNALGMNIVKSGSTCVIVPDSAIESGFYDPMMGYPWCTASNQEPPYYLNETSRSWFKRNSSTYEDDPYDITAIPTA